MDRRRRQQQQPKEKEGFTILSIDKSFFFYDCPVSRVWITENNRPIVRVTGSHKHSCIFVAVSMEWKKQLFRQYDKFNGDTFLNFLKKIHTKFPKCYLFMDKASPHHKSKKVKKFFDENKDADSSISFNHNHNTTRVHGNGKSLKIWSNKI